MEACFEVIIGESGERFEYRAASCAHNCIRFANGREEPFERRLVGNIGSMITARPRNCDDLVISFKRSDDRAPNRSRRANNYDPHARLSCYDRMLFPDSGPPVTVPAEPTPLLATRKRPS